MTIMAEVIEQENKKKQTNEGGSNDENNNNNGQEEELFFDCLTISEDEYANIIPKDMDLEDGLSLLCLVNEVRFQTGLYRNPSYPLSKCFQYLITYYETETEITSTSTSTNTSTSFMENNSSNNNDNHNHKEQRGRITKLVLGPMPGTTTYDTRIPELPPMIEQFQQLQSLELHGFRQLPKELNNLGSHCLQSLTLKSCVPSLFFNMPTAQQFTKLGQNLKYIQLESNDFIRYQPTFDFITKQLPNLETLSLIGSYPNNEQDTPKILTALLGGDTKDACAFQHTLKVLELQQMGINETQLIHSILYGIAPLYTNLTELHLMYNNVGSLQPLLTIIQQQKQQQQQQQEMTGDGRRPSSQAPQPPLVNTTTLRTINLSQNPIADQIQQKFNEKEETILPKEEKDAILYLLNTFTGISNLLLFENKDPPSLWRRRVHPREEQQQQQQQQVQAQAQAQQEPEQEDEPPETLLFDSDIEYLLRINHAGRKYITPSTQSHYHHAGEGEEEEEEGKRTVEELHEEELLTKNETSKKDDVDGTITFVKKIVHDNDKEVTPSSSSSSTPSLSPSITPNNIIKPQLWPLILERAYNKSDEITVYVKQDNSIAPRTAFTSRYGGPRGSIIAKKKKAKCPTGMHYMIRHGSVLQDIIAARRNDM
ncbi:hypothetical protein FRACYDRAFT_244836 [Fragilariopsis cylindrus CCMP1102]|uniref:RNI-like protein n=1 Tax=Fragilariopsis cylindrus CCMP1102 TaxID=635003 RepID=A0A1E7F1M3_9STRA|nr:hypothetical protein FRACYDRAFT_244836 [Fragilariopsis cylindrus CCMP1102]|eukprot:OEU11713.1 hypothetical protein FRACYDRAFT_244836 [Fragilariopsis cylindrus CCMP1102]